MPIYEYRCPKCDARFEELIRNDADQRRLTCPKCGEKKIERQPSVFSAQVAPTRSPAKPGCGGCSNSGACPYGGA